MPMPAVDARGRPTHARTSTRPAELDAIVTACLAKRPEQRPASADALAALLRACPVRDVWDDAAARAWWDRHALPSRRILASRPSGDDPTQLASPQAAARH